MDAVHRYHDGTKHHFNRFARSLGYLDWATQPDPFRSFAGAPLFPLYPASGSRAEPYTPRATSYDRVFSPAGAEAVPVSASAIGDLLRHALGLSAWKQFGQSRWSLRVNPSSGNLHPTEAYVITGPLSGLAATAAVYHYAADHHALEQRAAFDPDVWSEIAQEASMRATLAPAEEAADTGRRRRSAAGRGSLLALVALTSIHWREAWKYGERAFRYCQHDLGHAIAALRLAASVIGWSAAMQADWSQAEIGALVGLDRDEDYRDAEREEPGCLLAVVGQASADVTWDPGPVRSGDGPTARGGALDGGPAATNASGRVLITTSRRSYRRTLLDAVGRGRWFGRANQLSPDYIDWTFIDEIARATEDRGREGSACGPRGELWSRTRQPRGGGRRESSSAAARTSGDAGPAATPGCIGGDPRAVMNAGQEGREGREGRTNGSDLAQVLRPAVPEDRGLDARRVILQRRSALAFDGQSSIDREAFLGMLARTMPGPHAPWDAIWWTPRIYLALFVHRVDGVAPGLYCLPRVPAAVDRLRSAFGRDFLWEAADDRLPLYHLARGDCRRLAKRLSCDQDIASDGFFSLGMIADFDASLDEHGPSFYRHLFWESGIVGQVLYLEAEAAGARSTGIGCFYDDPVHDVLGIADHRFQSLYHFTVGMPVEDTRLTTDPGYEWERGKRV